MNILLDEKTLVNVPPTGGLSFIEHLRANALEKCPKTVGMYVVGVNHQEKKAMIFTPNCKQWSCEVCSLKNAKRWIARIINGVNQLGGDWYMLTLTSHEHMRGTEKSLKCLRDGFSKLYDRMKRRFGSISYVKVWEMHEDKTLHLHFLINVKMPKKWLKDNARACGLGYQIDVHEIDNAGQVAGYVAKYTLKNAAFLPEMPKGLRRIQASLNFPKLPQINSFSKDWQWTRLETELGVFNIVNPVYLKGYDVEGTIEGDAD